MVKNELVISSSSRKYTVEFCSYLDVLRQYDTDDVVFIVDDYLDVSDLKNHKVISLTASEYQKSFDGVGELISKLTELDITRNTKLVAFGGGVIQDVTSFTASIMFRGIEWDFIPTTLLAQGDSCIGSKTSINFSKYKNRLGNFYPPSAVYIDVSLLDTLPNLQLMSGLGELLHYIMIDGEESLRLFQDHFHGGEVSLSDLIRRCLSIKKTIIENDEFDRGERIILNYGHSFGHAIEGAMENKIPHGIAVAYGMDCANFISCKMGMMNRSDYNRYNEVLSAIYKEYPIDNMETEDMIQCLGKDKKNTRDSYRVILSHTAGDMFVQDINKDSTLNIMIDEWRLNYEAIAGI